MKEYILWGVTEEELKEALDMGLPVWFRLVFNEFGFSHIAVTLSDRNAINMRLIIRELNRKRGSKLQLFTKEEWEAA